MIIILPVGMNYRTERLPVVTLSLIGLNTLVYLVTLVCFFCTAGESDHWILHHFWLTPANWTWYACFTHMFVHAGFFHLLGNMIFLFLFGCCVEDLIGRVRFAIFYLLGGLVAEMAYIALTPAHFMSPIPMGGASGAISACMGMYLLLRADADIEFKYFITLFFRFWAGEFSTPAWMAISFWFLKDLFWAVLGLIYPQLGGGVAFGAHVGGLLGGMAMVAIYQGVAKPRESETETSRLIIDPVEAMAAAVTVRKTDATETPTIFLHDGNDQTGPFTLSQVQEKLQHGEIGLDAEYWSEGMNDWQSVVDLSGHPIG